MRLIPIVALVLLVALTGCASNVESEMNTSAAIDDADADAMMNDEPSPHGESVAMQAQLPVDDGAYPTSAQEIDYGAATGYLASPNTSEQVPGVVLIHEWWGLNDNIKATANKLASYGYNVLAVDLYGGQVASNSSQARELVGSVDQEAALQNLQAAQEYLRSVGSESVGSWGFCFGGGQSMNLAVSEFAPDASVIFYGNPITDSQQLASINQPVLGVFGSLDQGIPVDDVQAFDQQLDGVTEHNVIIYEGADHAFANPSGDRFNEEAASAAWQETLSFLEQNLQ